MKRKRSRRESVTEKLQAHSERLHEIREKLAESSDKEFGKLVTRLFRESHVIFSTAFRFKKGATYDEVAAGIARKKVSPELKDAVRSVAETLNALAYSPKRTRDDVIRVIDELQTILKRTHEFEVADAKRKEHARKVPRTHRIARFLKRATTLLWFPLSWLYLFVSQRVHRLLLHRDPAYQINMLLARGHRALEREDLKSAVATYDRIRDAYEASSHDLRSFIRPRIIEYYNEIIEVYERKEKV